MANFNDLFEDEQMLLLKGLIALPYDIHRIEDELKLINPQCGYVWTSFGESEAYKSYYIVKHDELQGIINNLQFNR